jgi:hypothetical protein
MAEPDMLHIVLALTLDKVITVHPVTCVSPLEQTGVDNLTNRKYHRRTAVLRLVGDNDLLWDSMLPTAQRDAEIML